MDSNSESDSSLEYDLQNLFESSEDEESIELSSKPSSRTSSGTSTPRPKHSIGAWIQAVTFLELGIPHLEITRKTGVSKAQLYKLRDKALSRGWDPKISGIVEISHIEDAPCSEQPKVSQDVTDHILKTVTQNSTTRGWSCARIAYEVSLIPGISQVSEKTVWRVLRENKYFSYKRTVKPGLKLEDKAARLKWYLEHEHWTLEDWKNMIWTDKTSVQLGSV